MKPSTPIPWRFNIRKDNPDEPVYRIEGGRVLAPFDTLIVGKLTRGRSRGTEQDFRYIAHACNLYPELVEALEQLCKAASDEWTDSWEWFDRARAVLAKCRVEP